MCILDLCPVAEHVAALISAPRFFVIEFQSMHAQLVQSTEFGRFRDSVVIRIGPLSGVTEYIVLTLITPSPIPPSVLPPQPDPTL